MKRVYLDNAATTKLIPEVLDAMMPYMTEVYGNPSSPHYFGQQSGIAVDKARQQVATALNADPSEIIFMSGGSEADNMAIRGIAERYSKRGKHIITSAVEHHAVLHTCQLLE